VRYFLELAYDGTAFAGWQIQPGTRTVQQVVEDALSLLLKCPIGLTGSGRTDTGVHAAQQFAHFDVADPITDVDQLIYRLARLLPPDVKPIALFPVSDRLHARFSAVARTYHYHIHLRPNPFQRFFSTFFGQPLDFEAMNAAAAHLLGEHDFTTFSKTKGNVAHYRCVVHEAMWHVEHVERIPQAAYFVIRANRFLRGQVRLIAGTLLDVGRGRLSVNDFEKALVAQDRRLSSGAAPAQGLSLVKVSYEKADGLEQ
jgi:tRNA pseudouridine38-40 synthase